MAKTNRAVAKHGDQPGVIEGDWPREFHNRAWDHFNQLERPAHAYLIDGEWISCILADGSRVLARISERRPAR